MGAGFLFLIGGKLAVFVRRVNLGAVRRLDDELSLAVLIEIIEHKLAEVSTGGNVVAQVDSPQGSAVELIAVEDGRAAQLAGRGVELIGGVPLDYDLVLAVAVHIRRRAVIGLSLIHI